MEDFLIDILQSFQNDENYKESDAVDDILHLFNVVGQSEQLVCNTCKFYPVDYDSFCATCKNFEKHVKAT